MKPSDVRCGVIVYAAKEQRFRSCRRLRTLRLLVKGQEAFGFCSQHRARIESLFPGIESERRCDCPDYSAEVERDCCCVGGKACFPAAEITA